MLLPRKRGRALIEALNRDFAPGRVAHPTLAGRQGAWILRPPPYRVLPGLGPSRTTRRKRLRSSLTGPELAQRLRKDC